VSRREALARETPRQAPGRTTTRPPAAADRAATVLQLQRSIGNRAVARLVNPAPRRALQRYESAEHLDLGDRYLRELADFAATDAGKDWIAEHGLMAETAGLASDPMLSGTKITVGGLDLSPGEIVALSGDFYESPEELEHANPKELQELVAAIHREQRGELKDPNAIYQSITLKYRSENDSYLNLATRNQKHFAPGNRLEWKRLHTEAIQMAKAAGSDEVAFNRALLYDAAAGHYLTDAYASGHMFDRRRIDTEIQSYITAHPPAPTDPQMSTYYMVVGSHMRDLVLKNVHDRLNNEGVEVTNPTGMKWRTYGDTQLSKAADTQKIAAMALAFSRAQIYHARKGADPDADDVVALMPDDATIKRVTEQAVSYIPAAAADITGLIYRQRSIVGTKLPPGIAQIVESNITTVANPGRQRQLEQLQDVQERTGIPQVAPSFTVFQWK
jgi:hypothetical protein